MGEPMCSPATTNRKGGFYFWGILFKSVFFAIIDLYI